jgi:DtxR family Mn-dependent transcriptional regulator
MKRTSSPAASRTGLQLSQSQEDYLKALYLVRREGRRVTTSELSARLAVSPASAAEMLGRLSALGLVVHDRYRGAELTPAGEEVAVEMVRHHRLLEMYLAEMLGYRWDEVHEEAERLEHFISERMEERIYDALGRPALDPHGDPIPTVDGRVNPGRHRPLTECRPGERLIVRRVSDREADKLRELARLGIGLGSVLEVLAESVFEGPITVRVGGGRRATRVPLGIARVVFLGSLEGGA